MVKELQDNNFLSNHAVEHLHQSYENVPNLLMKHYLKNTQNESVTQETYPSLLRQFASMSHFYSPKGYEYVRQTFALALPEPRTLRSWYSNVDCSLGYVEAAFNALKIKISEASARGREVICSLLLDEQLGK